MAELTVQFGTASQFGTQTGWVAQSPTIEEASTRRSWLGAAGDEVASKLHDKRVDCSQEFLPAAVGSPPSLPSDIGALLGSYITTQISVATKNNEEVRMSLNGHNHSTNAHEAGLKTAAHGITLSKMFGAIDFLGGTAGSNATVDNSTLEITCEHKDRLNGDGENCVGQNYNAKISVTVQWLGVPEVACGAGWDKVSVTTDPNNEDFLVTTVRAEKALVMSVPVPEPGPG